MKKIKKTITKTVERYKTEDGKQFILEKDALEHEDRLKEKELKQKYKYSELRVNERDYKSLFLNDLSDTTKKEVLRLLRIVFKYDNIDSRNIEDVLKRTKIGYCFFETWKDSYDEYRLDVMTFEQMSMEISLTICQLQKELEMLKKLESEK
jgi:hypothetical protein